MKQNNRNNCNMNIQANNFQNTENTLNGNQNTKIMTEDILNSHFLKELSNFNFKNGNIFNCDGNGGQGNEGKNENNGLTMNSAVNNSDANFMGNTNYNCLNQLNTLQSLFNCIAMQVKFQFYSIAEGST